MLVVYGGTPPVQPKLAVSGTPTVPVTVAEPPTESAGGLIVKVKSRVSEVFCASTALTVKVYVPAVVGVPVTSAPFPAETKLSPGGRFPPTIE
jgi:hypothetical protein